MQNKESLEKDDTKYWRRQEKADKSNGHFEVFLDYILCYNYKTHPRNIIMKINTAGLQLKHMTGQQWVYRKWGSGRTVREED